MHFYILIEHVAEEVEITIAAVGPDGVNEIESELFFLIDFS
jgi:hypothetical protein